MYSVLQRLSELNMKYQLLQVQGGVTQHKPSWNNRTAKQQQKGAGRDQLCNPHKPYQLQAEQVWVAEKIDAILVDLKNTKHTAANSSPYYINSIFPRGFPRYF